MSATLELPRTLKGVNDELTRVEQRLQRLRWAADPNAWASEKLHDTLWSGQRKILEAVRDHRKTAAATCHEIGKSYDAAILAAWWIDTHKPGEAFVITTAPTNPQVRVILWKEIGRAHQRGQLIGRVIQTEWKLRVGDKEETVAMGRKPSDYAPTAFQGIHAKFVLVIVDEANGVRGMLWDALDSLMANEGSKMLAIGNPDDPTGEFCDACKPGSGWAVVHISAFDSPNFTGEPLADEIKAQLIGHTYVEERRLRWAPSWKWNESRSACVMPADGKLEDTHPFWQSKVLGHFPVQAATGSLIPLTWIRAAQERTLPPVGANELGLDVGASEGGDPSCLGHRRGPVFRVLWEQREPDTMKTTGRLLMALADKSLGATLAKVDYIGVGRGVVDRSREQQLPVHPIEVGNSATLTQCLACRYEWDDDPQNSRTRCPKCASDALQKAFPNLLSQLWWDIRGMFERAEIDIDVNDEQLAEELLTIRWEPNSKGQIVVKYSTEAASPNRADALLMSYAPVPKPTQKPSFSMTWGR
jgi:predicted Zn-ribbon and HTH transcriptional regulator